MVDSILFVRCLCLQLNFFACMFISKVCAAGDGVSADLALEVEAVNNTPLDEGPGEGWHRASSQTLSKVSASHQPWLMGSV